ncbi:MAG: hypothetical protein PHE32_03575 [Candidatus Shapirobacteria bacterium]|nr:hypothetical protein [Candidatus Shapirobacteria bacterium]MDD4410754.1 hypothetical protein [Candidatus Shapirobacteria bacterium]
MEKISDYMTQKTRDLLKVSIETLEKKREAELTTVNESYDLGTFRQSATVLDALGGWNSIEDEISRRTKALNNAVIIREGESVEGFIIGRKLVIRFENEDKNTILKIGTPWDATISTEVENNSETISFQAPIISRLNKLKPGDETMMNKTKIKLIDISQPNKEF